MMSSNVHETEGQRAGDGVPWTSCRNINDLLLPNELLHKILLTVICDSVHTICISPADTTWEKGMLDTFHEVSPAFKAISTELVAKAFDIPKLVRTDDASLLRTMREIFVYLSHLGARLRHPSDWGSVSFQTIDCSASSFVFAYALYLSCISLRRNATRSPRDVFESTHKVILSALTQSRALCTRVLPREMTSQLRQGILDEFRLARDGLTLVHSFNELDNYANSVVALPPFSDSLPTLRASIHTSLCKIEETHKVYIDALSNRMEPEPPIHDLPGVLPALRNISKLTFDEEEYNLEARIGAIVAEWAKACPFLNGESKRFRNDHQP